VHGVGDEKISVRVGGLGERNERRLLRGIQSERIRITRQLRQHRLPIAHPSSGVLGPDWKERPQAFDIRAPADGSLDRPSERFRDVRSQSDLRG